MNNKHAQRANDILNNAFNKDPVPCSKACKYFKFPNNKTACVLSSIFSVPQGEMCHEFVKLEDKEAS